MFILKKKYSIWFTGLPSSGKTTIAKELIKFLKRYKIPCILLDGDEIRKIITNNNFDLNSRIHSTKQYTKLCKILIRSNILIIVSTNHHTNLQRKYVRKKLKKKYFEIWVNTPLSTCKNRDVKKLYKKAEVGKIKNLVGFDLKFEKPLNYDLKINTKKNKTSAAVVSVINKLIQKGVIKKIIY